MFPPLVRFHARVGVRLALTQAAPLVGLPIIAVLLQDDPGGAARALARWLYATGDAGRDLAIAAAALGLAGVAARRVAGTLTGWLRHLPVTETAHRRAALVAVLVAQAPLVCAVALLAPIAQPPAGRAVVRLVVLLLTTSAAAIAAWPAEHSRLGRALALSALLLVAGERAAGLLAAPVLLVVAERLAGPLPASRRPARRLGLHFPTSVLIGLRALGATALGGVVLALLPLAAAAAFRANNQLPAAAAAGAARLGGGLSVALLIAGLVARLARRRPAWGWARSLPVGAARRAANDALLLAVLCVVPVGVTAALTPFAAVAVAACVPALVFRGAGALDQRRATRTGPAAPVLLEGALVACLVTLLPWLSLVALAATPLAWRAAAAVDRGLQVSRWEERWHSQSGDPLSWRAQ